MSEIESSPEAPVASTSNEGRNLAHFGCLIGLIIGLAVGIFIAWALILHNVTTILALLFWVGLTIILGSIGYWVGSAVSPRRTSSTV